MRESAPIAEDAEAALAELLEVAALMVSSFVWSPEALPLAERLATAVERVAAVTEGRSSGTKRDRDATNGQLAEGLTDALTTILAEFGTGADS